MNINRFSGITVVSVMSAVLALQGLRQGQVPGKLVISLDYQRKLSEQDHRMLMVLVPQ